MKRYIRAMSMEKKRALAQVDAYAPIIMEHIIKILVYGDIRPDDVKGWIHTIANWIYRADSITVKPSAKKLTQKDLESTLFSCMGDDVRDYERELYKFQADNLSGKFNHDGKGTYPEFEIDADLADDLMTLCYDIIDGTIPLLCDKKDHSLDEYESVIEEVFKGLQYL